MTILSPLSCARAPLRVLAGVGIAWLLVVNTACGGGGSSSGGGSTPPPTPSTTTTVAGCADKGIIQNGAVAAYEWSGGQWVQRGAGTTDAKGNYSVSMSGYTGQALKLVVSATSGATMKWDGPTDATHTFGQAIPLPGGFAMQAILPPTTASSLTNVPITPYTSMADALVEAAANKDATTIQQAIATVNVMTGFDVAHTRALDITDAAAMQSASEVEQRAAAMTAALAFIPGRDPATVMAQLDQSIADGHFTSSDPITVSALTKAWTDALANANLAANLGNAAKNDVQVAAQMVNAATSNGAYTPTPPANPPSSGIAAAKGLVGDARSLVSNLVQTDFTTPLGSAQTKVQTAAGVFNKDAAAMVQILDLAVQQGLTQVGTATDLRTAVMQNGSVQKTINVTSVGSTLGTLNLTVSNASSVKVQLSGSLSGTGTNGRTVTVNATLDTGMDLNKFDWTTLTTTQTSTQIAIQAAVGDGVTSLAISQGTLSVVVAPGTASQTPMLTGLTLSGLKLALTTQNAAFNGTAEIDTVPMASATAFSQYFHQADRLTLKKVSLSGTFTLGTGEILKADLGINLANADAFDIQAFLNAGSMISPWAENILTDAQIQSLKSAFGIPFSAQNWNISAYVDPQWNSNSAYIFDGTTYKQIDPAMVFAVIDPGSYWQAQFAGNPGSSVLARYLYASTYNGTTSSYLGASIQLGSVPETTSQFLQVGLTMDFELTGVTGLQPAKIALSANRSSLTGGDLTLGVSWGTSQYTFTFSGVDVAAKTGSLTIANGQGTSLVLKDINTGSATGAIYVGSTKVADVQQISNGLIKISYLDGTFETLQ